MPTANSLYKQYKKTGGTLSFGNWIDREKKKKFLNFESNQTTIPTNKPLADSINNVLNNIHRDAGYRDTLENKYILGINKTALIVAGVLVLMGVSIFVYVKSTD